jgi:hypothetical protein
MITYMQKKQPTLEIKSKVVEYFQEFKIDAD